MRDDHLQQPDFNFCRNPIPFLNLAQHMDALLLLASEQHSSGLFSFASGKRLLGRPLFVGRFWISMLCSLGDSGFRCFWERSSVAGISWVQFNDSGFQAEIRQVVRPLRSRRSLLLVSVQRSLIAPDGYCPLAGCHQLSGEISSFSGRNPSSWPRSSSHTRDEVIFWPVGLFHGATPGPHPSSV